MEKKIWFDMDGTIANLYGVENWLPMLDASDPTPYKVAAPLVNMNVLARKLNELQRAGWEIGVVSWLSKYSTPEYDKAVTAEKLRWLRRHLRSVKWDTIHIVTYGRNKWELCGAGILFDDEARNRDMWGDEAYHPDCMMEVLLSLSA